MAKIGKLTPSSLVNPVDGEFDGHLRTLTMDLSIRTITNPDNRSDRAPDLLVQALGQARQWVEVGLAWWKPLDRKEGASDRYLSITIQDPSMPEALHCAAFREEGTNNWLITWRPRKPNAPMSPSPGTSGQASAA
jgi:uncharacterized protein (DUF736 family)